MTIQDDIKALSAEDFAALKGWIVNTETDRRANAPVVDAAKATVVEDLRKAGTIPNPAPPVTVNAATKVTDFPAWKSPGTDHSKMYTYKHRVSKGGKVYESQVQGLNSWEPGGAGVYENVWRDVTATVITPPADTTPAVAAFKQPTGAHDAYALGAKVTFEGATYESLIAANTYSPSAYPAGWKKL